MIVDAASIDRTVLCYVCNHAWIASKGADDPGCVDRRRGKNVGELARSACSKRERGPLAVNSYPVESTSKSISNQDQLTAREQESWAYHCPEGGHEMGVEIEVIRLNSGG